MSRCCRSPVNTFGPGLRKQRACVPCPSGYSTMGKVGQSRIDACLVPPGYYLKTPGQAVPCPAGEYKEGVGPDGSCTKCAFGVTTAEPGSTSNTSCSCKSCVHQRRTNPLDNHTGSFTHTAICTATPCAACALETRGSDHRGHLLPTAQLAPCHTPLPALVPNCRPACGLVRAQHEWQHHHSHSAMPPRLLLPWGPSQQHL